ncbi:hypothetical protein [Streptomyces aidingensis]|uniref:Uncharacterized protein n=1 Tax=Streptomyces aidingensis TaxID=910347 RepID=A0A1I1HEC9_9ACTN|nr:hypothetical protein [Streptomyces aidingensis]SFC21952.1 hypothetical protein SAMN05421773_102345 [Streptomyces aidingensis]
MLGRLFSRNVARSLVAALAVLAAGLLHAAPAQAAYGAQLPVTVQVVDGDWHYNQNLGKASGWVQFDSGKKKFRYSLTVDRQSSYTPPDVLIYANGSLAVTEWNAQGTISGEFTHSYDVVYVRVVIQGDTFHGSQYVSYRSDGGGENHGSSYGRVYNPYV